MKNIILAAALCVISTGLFAQVSKGTLFVGSTIGSTNYNSITNNYDYVDSGLRKTTNHNFGIGLNPQLGVFVTDHHIVGGSLGFVFAHNKQNIESTEGNLNSNDTRKNTFTINVGPFVRYYFFNTAPGSTLFFAQLDAKLGTGSGNSSGNGDNVASTFTSSGKITKIFNWNAGGSIGVTHFIQKNVGLDIFAGYNYSNDKSHNLATTNYTSKSGGANTVNTSDYDLTTHSNNIILGAGFHWLFASHKS
jgi:hypothetical protein